MKLITSYTFEYWDVCSLGSAIQYDSYIVCDLFNVFNTIESHTQGPVISYI